ncbi:MAG TPA: aspartate kinase, partial [Lachnospiraceae bacterium]|nr:aspartate kinase [Lachnospiraceae bacterium]
GITGKKGFVAMSFEKDIGSDRLTFGRKILQVFEEAMVMVEHVPSSIGTMTVVVSADEIKGKEESILRRIRREIDPYSMKVERNLALVAVVGQRIADVIGSTYQILKAIADQNIGVRLVIQGVNEITLIVGVDEKDFEKTVECLYEYRQKAEKEQSEVD